jgi:TrmH family RNA methyltransferase
MISINQKKYVNSLKQKKFRTKDNSFVVEGVKMIEELLQSDYEVKEIYATQSWIEINPLIDCNEVSEKELSQISSLSTPNEVIAVVKQKEHQLIDISSSLTIALDKIQDPGNLGTIIRTADWFCIQNIVCSENSVDVYNSKVMQATMGSFFRVNIVYDNLKEFFRNNGDLKVYGALLEGQSVYVKGLNPKGSVLLMGNESKGISEELIPFITDKISIPKIGGAESLNVSTATAIICSELKRN